ncbi:MAG: S8 family serine peptidase [Vallitalea sp.]|jgi:hypothetical protein|nr:S8 family serine peptidase [Vallitalea sp.]
MKKKFILLIGCIMLLTIIPVNIFANNNVLPNSYEQIDNSKVEYKNGKITSSILPYGDVFSESTKLPLGHTKATGKSINIGFLGDENYAEFIYFVARDSKVIKVNSLSIDKLKDNNISVLAIQDLTKFESTKLISFVEDCDDSNISVIIPGDMDESANTIRLINELYKQNCITVGRVFDADLGTYYIRGKSNAVNRRIKDIKIDIFAPEMYMDYWNKRTEYRALYGTVGAVALIKQYKGEISNFEIKNHIKNNSRKTWLKRTVDGEKCIKVKFDECDVTSYPNEDTYYYNLLDFKNLLDVKLANQWNANIYNCYKAWDISKGNIDVAVFDRGYYLNDMRINNNVVERKVFGDENFKNMKEFHGSDMAAAVLTIAPEAKLHLFALDSDINVKNDNKNKFIQAINYCIKNNIKVITTSYGPQFNDDEVSNAINKAIKNDITFCWFAYGEYQDSRKQKEYKGAIKPSCNWDNNSGPYALDRYMYHENESAYRSISWGRSPTSPQIAGLVALIKAANPRLTPCQIEELLKKHSKTIGKGNFVPDVYEIVKKNGVKNYTDIRLFLFNKNRLNNEDMKAINKYSNQFMDNTKNILLDVSKYKTFIDVYYYIQKRYKNINGKIKGIQIFGTSDDVPAFDMNFKVQTLNGIDNSEGFKTDHFYSNINSTNLDEGISIYDVFSKKLNVDFVPEWPVARLSLTKGEIAPYFERYYDYINQINGKDIPLVDFSSPIFDLHHHSDDTGILLNRLCNEFKLINKEYYKLYGNLKGKYPVESKVIGEFNKESLIMENKKGIINLTINSHGQWNNVDQYVVSDYEKKFSKQAYRQNDNGNNETVFRISLVNMDTINKVLDNNYYTLFSRSCLNAYKLNNNNLIHEAMANGKMISAIANSSIGSNNGIDVYSDLKGLMYNNPAYNYLIYVYSLYSGNTISDSFYKAKKAYVEEVLNHKILDNRHGNYQFQLHNVLSQTYIGLLATNQGNNITVPHLLYDINECINNKNIDDGDNIPVINKTQNDFIEFKDDNLKYGRIKFCKAVSNPNIIVNEVSSAIDNQNVYVKIKYNSPIQSNILIFLQDDTPGLKMLYPDATKIGDNTIIIKFHKKTLKSYTAGLAINIGHRNFVFIEKKLIDSIADITMPSIN